MLTCKFDGGIITYKILGDVRCLLGEATTRNINFL